MNKSILLLVPILLTGCVAAGPNTQQGAVAGGALGALTGAIIGNNSHAGSGQGALIGGIAGALAGGTLGNAEDNEHGTFYETVPLAVPTPQPEYCTPMPTPGYVWVPGYWEFRYDTYFWHAGYWTYDRGYTFVPPHWRNCDRGHVWVPPYWKAPTRYDRGHRR